MAAYMKSGSVHRAVIWTRRKLPLQSSVHRGGPPSVHRSHLEKTSIAVIWNYNLSTVCPSRSDENFHCSHLDKKSSLFGGSSDGGSYEAARISWNKLHYLEEQGPQLISESGQAGQAKSSRTTSACPLGVENTNNARYRSAQKKKKFWKQTLQQLGITTC